MDWMGWIPGLDWDGLNVMDWIGSVWTPGEVAVCLNCVFPPLFPVSTNATMAKGLTIAPQPTHPTSFDRRHREKVFLCVIYPARPMNKISKLNGLPRTKLRNLLRLLFSLFNPVYPLFGLAGGSLCNFQKICWVVCLLVTGRSLCWTWRARKKG